MSRAAWGRLLVLALSVSACATNPATGRPQLSLISTEQEIELGQQGAQDVVQSIGLVDDPALQKYVSRIGQRMAARSERPDLPWSFAVVDDPAVNAFALPGGQIFVTRGLMTHLMNEAQLAAIVGHEIGHVTARHSVERLSKAQVAQLGLGIGMVFSEELRQLAPLASTGLGLLFLKFSRDDEYQADELGIRYAGGAGYALEEMPEVFRTLDRVSEAQGDGGRLPEWLATHPSSESRIERIREALADLPPAETEGTVDRRPYLQHVEGLAYGTNPREGFFRGNRFYHPELRFTLQVPEGWQTANLREAVVASSPEQDAMIQVTLARDLPPDQALRELAANPDVEVTEPLSNMVSGLPSASARVLAQTEQGVLDGIVSFVRYDGRTYQLLSVAAQNRLRTYASTFRQVHASFGRLDDPELIDVEPPHIELLTVPERMTLAELYRQRPTPVDLETIALLNQLQPDSVVAQGRLLKWVRGGRTAEQPPVGRLPQWSPYSASETPPLPAMCAASSP